MNNINNVFSLEIFGLIWYPQDFLSIFLSLSTQQRMGNYCCLGLGKWMQLIDTRILLIWWERLVKILLKLILSVMYFCEIEPMLRRLFCACVTSNTQFSHLNNHKLCVWLTTFVIESRLRRFLSDWHQLRMH